ncbi:hypothetical protein Leryth_017033 [Lithospermum erythrorhizon]|nr:hypothetical protein Leryth_017033 [Lithospermum erythrorhizon]
MEWERDEKEAVSGGRRGVSIHGWEIDSSNRPILASRTLQQWEEKLETCHLPEMVFGDSSLTLKHIDSGIKFYFSAFDALQLILDYDYTFTTPYCGSQTVEVNHEDQITTARSLHWEDCQDQIDVISLSSREPILFYDEIILYEDELGDNGVSLLTVKVRVMPSGWFLLLRFWLRVDGALIRLRDTRMHCVFGENKESTVLRESCWREATFQALSSRGYPVNSEAYNDPSTSCPRLPIIMQKTQKLTIPSIFSHNNGICSKGKYRKTGE